MVSLDFDLRFLKTSCWNTYVISAALRAAEDEAAAVVGRVGEEGAGVPCFVLVERASGREDSHRKLGNGCS